MSEIAAEPSPANDAADDRPAEHGGGEAAPPIAGDPGSFPSDAELARTLIGQERRSTLSTLADGGYPYGSVVSHAVDDEGGPVVLISDMAEHTVNAKRDARASVLVTTTTAAANDPLADARCTLVGRMERVDEPGALRHRYLEQHPYASYYVDFTDFSFWVLRVERIRYVGGFGHMSWVGVEQYRDATVDPIAPVATGVIEHMNDDHTEANLLYVQALAGLPEATAATLVGIDRYGLTLQATVDTGSRLARVAFPEPLTGPDQARPAVIELLTLAREA
jgi:putative heme iron utilization protein